MAQFKVDDFLIELSFSSQKVLKGLEKAEKQTMQVASRIEKRLNKAFKVNPTPLNNSLKAMERNVDKSISRIEQRLKNTKAFKIKTQVEETIKASRQPRISGSRAITAAHGVNMSKLKGFDPVMQKYIRSQYYALSGKASNLGSEKFNAELAKLNQSLRETLSKFNKTTSKNNHSEHASNGLDVLASSAIKAGTAIYTFQSALAAYQRVMEVGLQRASSERSIDFVFGENAEQVKQFTKNLSQTTGTDLAETQSQFAGFGASAKESLGLDNSEKLFESVTIYGRLMGRSNEEIKRALIGFQQVASKGQVMSEEVKGQIAEALPGIVQEMTKAMGFKSEKQFFEAMKKGLSSTPFLLKLTPQLQSVIKAAGGVEKLKDSTQVQVDNLGNAWKDTLNNIFKGSEGGLQDFTRSLTNLLNTLGGSGKTLGESLGDLMKSMSNGVDDLTTISYKVQGYFDRVTLLYRELNDTQKALADGLANGLLSSLKGLAGIVAVRSGIGAVGGIWNLTRAITNLGNVANTAAGRINSRGSVEGGKGKLSVADAITRVMVVGMSTDVINSIVKPLYERQMNKSGDPMDKVRSKAEPTDQALTGDMNSLAAVLWAMVQGKSKAPEQVISPEALDNLKGRVDTFTQDLKTIIKPTVNIQPQTINITTQTVLDGKVIDERTTSHINRMQEDTLINSAYPEGE